MIKLALDILGDKETREKIGVVILSIVVLLMFAPVAVLMTMQDIDPPDVSGNFDQASWMQSLDSEQQNQIAQMESAGQQIASAMESVGVREQTIKAQLIYISCFDDVVVDDFNAYTNLFRYAPDDAALINSINQTYGLEIVYEAVHSAATDVYAIFPYKAFGDFLRAQPLVTFDVKCKNFLADPSVFNISAGIFAIAELVVSTPIDLQDPTKCSHNVFMT